MIIGGRKAVMFQKFLFLPPNEEVRREFRALILICAAALFAGSCELPGGPGFGQGTLTLGLSSRDQQLNQAARNVVTDAEAAQYIRYDYTLNGPGGTLTGSVSGTQNAAVHVVPGKWAISVKAYGKKYGDQNQSGTVLRGTGTAEVQVNAGENTYTSVKMTTATEVTTWADLAAAVGGNPNPAYPDREEIIIVKNDLTADSMADIFRKITIITDNPAGVTILRDQNYGYRLFDLRDHAYLTLGRSGDSPHSLVIDGNRNGMAGGVDVYDPLITLYNPGTLIMNDGTHLTGNYHNYSLGGDAGGAVGMEDGTFIMNGGEISGNATVGSGGAVYMNQSWGASTSFTMNGGLIANNTADVNGGAVYMYGTANAYAPFTFTMNGGEIRGNKPPPGDGRGGGVYVGPGNTFTNHKGTITLNEAFLGGGVFIDDAIFTMNGGSVSVNTAYGDGGGVYVDDAIFTMNGGSVSINIANRDGGGVYVGSDAVFTMSGGASIDGNTAERIGGGVCAVIGASGSFSMSGGSITGNTSNDTGESAGGVFFSGGPFTMTAGTITGNRAPNGNCGGFHLYNTTGNTALPANVQSLITGNTANGGTTSNFYNNNNQGLTTVGGIFWTDTGLGWSMGW
jgi:hypothetical protein